MLPPKKAKERDWQSAVARGIILFRPLQSVSILFQVIQGLYISSWCSRVLIEWCRIFVSLCVASSRKNTGFQYNAIFMVSAPCTVTGQTAIREFLPNIGVMKIAQNVIRYHKPEEDGNKMCS